MFHTNNKDEVRPCRASVKKCPFENHFKTEQEAFNYLEVKYGKPSLVIQDYQLIENFVEKNIDLYDIDELVGSENIYHKAKLLMYAKNDLRFPYKTSVDEITEEEKARIMSKAKSMNLKYTAMIQVAISSPAGWILSVMPNVEKQVYQETALFNYLKTKLKSFRVENLSAGGTNACYLVDGEIVSGLRTRPKSYPKSLDFRIITPRNNRIYVVAKYTMGEGGSQDNQYKDARIALEEIRNDSNVKIALILDGTHYQKRAKSDGKNRIDILQNEIINQRGLEENAFVGTYQEALNWIEQQ